MSDDRRAPWDEIIAQVVAPLVGLALTYYIGTHAATIEIEIRSRWRRLTEAATAARSGYDSGRRVAEWFVRQESPKVIAHAEEIARSAAANSSPGPSEQGSGES